ncbi:MAG: rhodanese-like domain-containing protein [Bacteroidetes bacterium]|nr:rhodanese-like domain-containing protein [Bacteroidota bacterium]
MKAYILPAIFLLFTISCTSDKKGPTDQEQFAQFGYIIKNSSQVSDKINDTNYVFLDTRHFSDYEELHIKGAFPADERGGTARLTLALLDTSKSLIVYCSTAVCDTKIFPLLKEMGFKNVIYLSDGFGGWLYKGYPTER